jgi:hypothetical protein
MIICSQVTVKKSSSHVFIAPKLARHRQSMREWALLQHRTFKLDIQKHSLADLKALGLILKGPF